MLKAIDQAMGKLSLNYEYMEWTQDIAYPYFVGECIETEPITEDGFMEKEFILRGTTKGSWSELEQIRDKIENYFNPIEGKTVATDKGSAAIFYARSIRIPSDDEDMKQMEIYLSIKEWKVI